MANFLSSLLFPVVSLLNQKMKQGGTLGNMYNPGLATNVMSILFPFFNQLLL